MKSRASLDDIAKRKILVPDKNQVVVVQFVTSPFTSSVSNN